MPSNLLVDFSLWTRLRRLGFFDAFSRGIPLHGLTGLFRLLESGRRLSISYDFSTVDDEVAEWIAADLRGRPEIKVLDDATSRIEEVIAYVRTKEDRRALLRELSDSVLLPRTTILVKSSTET